MFIGNVKKLLSDLVKNEQGTATLEYALILGLIFVGCMGVVAAIGPKVVARWRISTQQCNFIH